MNKLFNKFAFGPISQAFFNKQEPIWKATSILQSNDQIEGGPSGVIDFKPDGPYHSIRIIINGTGFPVGRHVIHIHVFGDISRGCQSTGLHMSNIYIGNVEAKEDGIISASFPCPFVTIFGVNGVLGRSVVIHEKAVDVNPNILTYFASPLFASQNEEKQVGPILACGSILFGHNFL